MTALNPYVQYQDNAVKSASNGELTLMLYNGLVKFLKLAVMAIEQKDFGGSHNKLVRAQDILAHLNDTLDYDYELSKNLSALYTFMIRQLVEANIKKDPGIIISVIRLAEELRDTWQKALRLV